MNLCFFSACSNFAVPTGKLVDRIAYARSMPSRKADCTLAQPLLTATVHLGPSHGDSGNASLRIASPKTICYRLLRE